MLRRFVLLSCAAALTGCPQSNPSTPDAFDYDITPIDAGPDAPTGAPFCSLGGTVVHDVVMPHGFCMHQFAQLTEPRVLAFAPNGDLFVAAPAENTAGGAHGGPGAIIVLSDDDHDGTAETTTFATGLPDVHGLAFAAGYLYFTTQSSVQRTPYQMGQRTETPGMRATVATFPVVDMQRWTHGLAISQQGTIYASQGVYSSMQCPDSPRNGSVMQIDGAGGMQLVASGLRNPMYARCHFADEVCLAAELGDDGNGGEGAHERLIRIRANTNYGFPCCTTASHTTHYNDGHFDCSMVPVEEASMPLNDTPFGFDWERGLWPLPFNGALVVANHGSFYSTPQWQGARVVFATTDPATHLPTGAFLPLVEGFGHDGTLRRPADVVFAPDGRLFMADDQGNAVYWIAPDSLRMR